MTIHVLPLSKFQGGITPDLISVITALQNTLWSATIHSYKTVDFMKLGMLSYNNKGYL